MASSALERAAKAKDSKKLLTELLVAWRELKHPRIAELIDRVSAKSLDGLKPITGKSVPARAEAIIEAVKSKDPVEVGRALMTQWPREWQAALPVLEAVCQAPEDPRIAARLATLIDEAANQSRGTRNFWGLAFGRLSALGDVRQLAVLEAQLTRSKSSYYREHSEQRERAIVERYRTLTVAPLSAGDEKLLAELEVPFGATVGVEKTKKRSGKELLEAVWANPTDLGVRTVYGDWLVEQGDPRGELIALQLGAPSEKSTRKIHSLIEKNWKKWLGPIADWFQATPRFEAGFPVWGIVAQASYRDGREKLEPLLSSPEWSTFRHLAMPWELIDPSEVVTRPRFKAVNSLGNLAPHSIALLAKSKEKPALATLEFSYGDDDDSLPAKTWDSFPQLERIKTSPLTLNAVLSGLGSQPLKVLELQMEGAWVEQPFDAWWKQLDSAPIERVQMHCYETQLAVTRAKAGAGFTRVEYLSAVRIERMVRCLPPEVTHLTYDPKKVTALAAPASALDHLDRALARYAKLEVRELPVAKALPHLSFELSSFDGLHVGHVEVVWNLLVTKFGLTFTDLQVGYSGTPRSLGPNPVAMLVQAAKNKRVAGAYLKLDQGLARCDLTRHRVRLAVPIHDVDRLLEAICELAALGEKDCSFQSGDLDADFPMKKWKEHASELKKRVRAVARDS
ncbi:MAG: TIGR02996 domain-containing protein [Archangium sp.]|nr:TIGR02996 domain-containing protein [Archangium sp.]